MKISNIKSNIKLNKSILEREKAKLLNPYNWWFPQPEIVLENAMEYSCLSWELYICLRVDLKDLNFDLLKNSYYTFFKKNHVYRLMLKGPTSKLDAFNTYNTHLIIYTKRLLEYQNIITSKEKLFTQYKFIDINLFGSDYEDTYMHRNIYLLISYIRRCLSEGLYNAYVFYNHITLQEARLDSIAISNDIIDMLYLDKLKVKLIILKPLETLPYYCI